MKEIEAFQCFGDFTPGSQTSIISERLDNLGRMHDHPVRLANITTERVINNFLEQGPKRLWSNPKSSVVKSNGGNNIPYSIFTKLIKRLCRQKYETF